MLLPLLPAMLAVLSVGAWYAVRRSGQATWARRSYLGANAAVLIVALLLPSAEATLVPGGMSAARLELAWDGASRLGAAVLLLATLAHQVTPREDRRMAPEALLVTVSLACLAAVNAQALALSAGLLCIAIVWVEGALPAGSRSPFAVFGLVSMLAALTLLGLIAAGSLRLAQGLTTPRWVVGAAVFGVGFGGLLLGYPALRWPTMAACTVTAAHLLQRLPGPVTSSPATLTLSLVVGGLAVLIGGLSTALWGPRGRALDALYGLTFGVAWLAAVLEGDPGHGSAVVALVGAVLAYSALVALERSEGVGWYRLPSIIAVGALAGLLPGGRLVARWRVLAASLSFGDGWLVFWQVVAGLLACWVTALIALPWVSTRDVSMPPRDWVAWGLGAMLALLSLALGVAPFVVLPSLGWFGGEMQGAVLWGLSLALLPALLGLGLAFWPAAARAQARTSRWRERVRPVWQGSWEGAVLWLDTAQQQIAERLYGLAQVVEERLLMAWGLLCALALLLVALEAGL